MTRPADEGARLELLLKSWAEKEWISITEIDGENSFDAKLIE